MLSVTRIQIAWLGPCSPYPCRLNCPNALAPAKVYPIGIPLLYAAILWKHRELLNPRIYTGGNTAHCATGTDSRSGDESPAAVFCTASKGLANNRLSLEELQELEEKVEARRENPELVPSMFLWKDFGETCKEKIGS